MAIGRTSDDRVEIRLDPPELGRVQIHLTRLDGGVQAVVLADRPETQDLLRRHAEALARELGQAGYDTVSLDFAAGARGPRRTRRGARTGLGAGGAEAPAAAAADRARGGAAGRASPAGSTSASDPAKERTMEITPTTTGTAATAARRRRPKQRRTAGTAAGAVTGDFQTFLTLLTTQMRNQDPLKPMDSTEFVAQLASFSAVEQQIRSNDRLQGILDVLSGGSPAGLAEWIGREVRVAAKADFAGEPVEVGVTPIEGADKAVLVVKNDFDSVVARLPVAADATEVSWDGTDDMGNALAHGRYGFTLESYAGETLMGTSEGKVFSTVRRSASSTARRCWWSTTARRCRWTRSAGCADAQPGSSSSLAALSIAASALEPPRSGCTRRISRR